MSENCQRCADYGYGTQSFATVRAEGILKHPPAPAVTMAMAADVITQQGWGPGDREVESTKLVHAPERSPSSGKNIEARHALEA